MKLTGIFLIVQGVLSLAYQGLRVTSREKQVGIGPLSVTTTEREGLSLPPIVGGLALITGIALVMTDRRKKSKAS